MNLVNISRKTLFVASIVLVTTLALVSVAAYYYQAGYLLGKADEDCEHQDATIHGEETGLDAHWRGTISSFSVIFTNKDDPLKCNQKHETFTVALSVSGNGWEIADNSTKNLLVHPGRNGRASFLIKIDNKPGEAKFTVTVSHEGKTVSETKDQIFADEPNKDEQCQPVQPIGGLAAWNPGDGEGNPTDSFVILSSNPSQFMGYFDFAVYNEDGWHTVNNQLVPCSRVTFNANIEVANKEELSKQGITVEILPSSITKENVIAQYLSGLDKVTVSVTCPISSDCSGRVKIEGSITDANPSRTGTKIEASMGF